MSAWIVSKKHVDLMVAAITEGTRDGVVRPRRRNRDRLGEMLVTECVASVSYRYNDDPGRCQLPGPCDGYYVKPYRFKHPRYLPTAAEFYKAVSCYEYQSCEHPSWTDSSAKRLCDQVRKEIEARVPEARRMRESRRDYPRYTWAAWETAPWGFEAVHIALCYAKAHGEGLALLRTAAADPDDEAPRLVFSDWLEERGMIQAGELKAHSLRYTRVEG
jgi:uncharacterized protein (TIGR02996 family)